MGYLALIFSQDEHIENTLGNDWSWENMDGGGRRFYPKGEDVERPKDIVIHYRGAAPWYQVVELVDNGSDLMVSVRVLEHDNAIPE